jgi:hypothetical protein
MLRLLGYFLPFFLFPVETNVGDGFTVEVLVTLAGVGVTPGVWIMQVDQFCPVDQLYPVDQL